MPLPATFYFSIILCKEIIVIPVFTHDEFCKTDLENSIKTLGYTHQPQVHQLVRKL